MEVKYVPIASVDCTSDPHPVEYNGDGVWPDVLRAMLEDIVAVCKSDLVQAIRVVTGILVIDGQEIEYGTDYYSDHDAGGTRSPATGDMAVKHKVAGLYFGWDFEPGENRKHLPPGLTGLKEFVKVALRHPESFRSLRVGVVWTFAGSASYSDHIEIDPDKYGTGVVNYGSQDWWMEDDGYLPWCQEMANLLGRPFPYGQGGYCPEGEGTMFPEEQGDDG